MVKTNVFKLGAVGIFLFISVSLFSGCFDLFSDFSSTKYVASPTHIQYTLSYGYTVQPTGSGTYEVLYHCEIPSVLVGSVDYELLYDHDYESKSLLNNSMIQWNISSEENQEYQLGLTAHVDATCYYLADLTGNDAQTIEEIEIFYPDVVARYCREQSNGTVAFITPKNSDISLVANDILQEIESENSLVVAKALFVWLKEHTTYKVHVSDSGVQPAPTTLLKRTGDCDDLSFLYISLCRSVGIPARFIRGYLLSEDTSGILTATPHAWTEIFVGGNLGNNGWIPVESASSSSLTTAEIHQNFGLESAFHLRLFVDDGSDESLRLSLSGISYKLYGLDRQMAVASFSSVTNYSILLEQQLVVTKDDQRSFE